MEHQAKVYYECDFCDFKSYSNLSLQKHISIQKHEKRAEIKTNDDEIKDSLCKNMDCERYPPNWDFKEDTDENYEQGQQWVKCSLCDGYFNDDGLCDILFIEEEPNNKSGQCGICGKTSNIIQMKSNGQFLCGNACDDEDEDE